MQWEELEAAAETTVDGKSIVIIKKLKTFWGESPIF